MRKIKVADAGARVLDWLVAEIEGKNTFPDNAVNRPESYSFRPTTNGNNAIHIMQREFIRTNPDSPFWLAEIVSDDGDKVSGVGPTIPVAAMRCFVKFKRGDVVEVPEELLC